MPDVTDPNDREPVKDFDNHPTDREAPPTRDEVLAALDRVLTHTSESGYATQIHEDHALLRRAYYAAANYSDGGASELHER